MLVWLKERGEDRTVRVVIDVALILFAALVVANAILSVLSARQISREIDRRGALAQQVRETTCQAIRAAAAIQAQILIDTANAEREATGRPPVDEAKGTTYIRAQLAAIDCNLILRGQLPPRLRAALEPIPPPPTTP